MDARITLGNLDPKNPLHKAAIDAMMAATIEFMRTNHGVVIPGITATIPGLAKWGAQLVSEPGRLIIALPRIDREANPSSTSSEDLFLAEGAAIPDGHLDLRLGGILEPWPIRRVELIDQWWPINAPLEPGFYWDGFVDGGAGAEVSIQTEPYQQKVIIVWADALESALTYYRRVRDGQAALSSAEYPTMRETLGQVFSNVEDPIVGIDLVLKELSAKYLHAHCVGCDDRLYAHELRGMLSRRFHRRLIGDVLRKVLSQSSAQA